MCPFGHPKIKSFCCRHNLLELARHILVFSSQPSLVTLPNQSSLWKGPQQEGMTSIWSVLTRWFQQIEIKANGFDNKKNQVV
jgi:hypothetical protein